MTMHYIGSVNGNGSATLITLSNIPATYNHLHVRCIARSAGVQSQLYIRLNGDGNNNYATHYIYGSGGGVAGGTGGSPTSVHILGTVNSSGSLANTFTVAIIDILDYTDTSKYTTLKAISGFDTNGAGESWLSSAVWMNTAAVTSVSLVANPALDASTRMDIYGITTNPLATGA